MLSCRALEKSNDPYIESLVEPCVSKNQKGIFAMWVWLERKFWKRAERMEKSIPDFPFFIAHPPAELNVYQNMYF